MHRLQAVFVTEDRWLSNLALLALCLLVGVIGGGLITFLTPPIALALLMAAVGGIMMLRSTQIGLFALVSVICLLPFAALPIDIGFSPTFLDLVLVVLFVVWFFRMVSGEQREFLASPLAVPILIFILLACATFMAGLAHAGLTANVLRHFAEIIISIFLFFVVVNCVRTRRELEGVVTVIILAGFAAALIGVVLYVLPQNLTVRLLSLLRIVRYPSGWGVLRFIEDNPDLPMRATSTSIDPNVLGGLLIFVTALTAPQLFAGRPIIKRILVAPMLAVMGLCMTLTFSRGSFAGLGVALMLIGLVGYRRLLLALPLVVAVFLIILLILPQTHGYSFYIERFWEGVRGQDLATRMRLGEYKDAFILISRYPWFGVGFAGTPDIDIYIGVSSVYLLIAEQMGLIGLASFLLVILVFFIYTWWGPKATSLPPDPGLRAILLGLQTAIAGALAGGVLDHYLFNLNFPHAVAIFWLYLGLGVTTTRLMIEPEGDL